MEDTILIVDDATGNLIVLSEILKQQYNVRVANSGEAALKALKVEKAPSLILLDIVMPDINGYIIAKKIRSDPKFENTPIIFISG